MHIPRHSPLLSIVDVIVHQGNFVLSGLAAPAEIWTPEYRDLFQRIAVALQEREAEPFTRVQWDLTTPGTQTFALAEGFSTIAPSDRNFYFRFSKPTTFLATLRHAGSHAMMFLVMGENNREHWTRKDARDGEVLEMEIQITKEDLENIGDWYWFLEASNFDREHTAECSLTIEYPEE